MSEDRIQQAIEAGEKNLRTMTLVRNWCANVKVVKHGGTGLVEMQTGLPIGHHFLECPHAPAGGMAAWDLADTAIDFYDRNCVDCKFRKPVGLPNISILVVDRDKQKKAREQEQARHAQVIADRLTAREAARQLIRQKLGALSAATLDQISELDRTHSDSAAVGLVELADLAPETFAPEIVEHLFDLAESQEHWLVEPSLKALEKLSVDPARLCNVALQSLRSYNARDVAAQIVEQRAQNANPLLIEAALPALISLANPMPLRFGIGDRPRRPVTGPLKALYLGHGATVKAGLKSILEKTDAYDVRTAARGIDALTDVDQTLLHFLPLQLVSKLVRAKHLVQGREDDVDDSLDDIRSVLTRAFLEKPKDIDALIEQYLAGARDENAAELYKVFDSVLREIRFDRNAKSPPAITDAHRLAFKRMVVAATNARGHEVENATTSLFHGDPYELTPLVREEIGLLLGSAAVLKTKLDELEAEKPERADQLFWMRQMGRRSYLNNLLHCFVRWSCIAAGKAGVQSVQEVLDFMRALPENNDDLRGAIVGCFNSLMLSVDTLALCLPDYYSALVGSQQTIRSMAATALGEMRPQIRENMPALVFEAFTALLTDPFIIVHRAAARALERFSLPNNLKNTAALSLSNLIACYSRDRNDDEFLMHCIDLYANRYAQREHLAGRLGDTLISIMKGLKPYSVSREIRHCGRLFKGNPNYAGLLLHIMAADDEAMSYHHEDLFDQLKHVPAAALYVHRDALIALAKRMPPGRNLHEVGAILELLTACGAWSEAADVSASAFKGIEDNTRNKSLRLHAKLRMIACALEDSVEREKLDDVVQARRDWDSTIQEIKQDNESNRLRRDPLRGLLDKN
jgi:hypothetical protein